MFVKGLGQGSTLGWLNRRPAYPNNDLAGRSISGGSTRRVALTERTRSTSAFLSLPLTQLEEVISENLKRRLVHGQDQWCMCR